MTQEDCLALPSHFTHLGICYPGSSASIELSSPQNPQVATFTVGDPPPVTLSGQTIHVSTSAPVAAPELSVPEPSTIVLFVGAMLVLVAYKRARRGTKLS